ncbi:MAG: acetyltransferase [Deltaproteobacteria bacterium]
MKNVVIFGTGMLAQVFHAALTDDSPYDVCAFTVHERHVREPRLMDLEVVPFEKIEMKYPPDEFAMMIAVGYKRVNRARAEIYSECKRKGYHLISHRSTSASLQGHVELGENSFIGDNCVIRTFTRIGNNVVVGGGCYIGQHTVIGDHCFVSQCASLGGNIQVEPYSFIGQNATIRNFVHIAANCVIGAGTVILADTKENEVYKATGTELLGIPSYKLRDI